MIPYKNGNAEYLANEIGLKVLDTAKDIANQQLNNS